MRISTWVGGAVIRAIALAGVNALMLGMGAGGALAQESEPILQTVRQVAQSVEGSDVEAPAVEGDRQTEADRLFQQGIEQLNISQFREALQSWEQALDIYQEIGDRQGESKTLGNLGNAHSALGQYQQAITLYEQVLEFFRADGDRYRAGVALANLALVHNRIGQYQQAITFYEQDLEITRELDDRKGEGITLGNLGAVYNNLGQYQQAITFYEQALAIAREIDDRRGESAALGNLGIVYDDLGQYQKAIAFYEQDLMIVRELGDQQAESTTLGNLGVAYQNLDGYQQAITLYEQALVIAQAIGDRAASGITLNNIGNLLAEQNQPQLAILFLKQSVNVREAIREDLSQIPTDQQQSFTDTVAGTYRKLAALLLQQNRVLEAQRVLDLLKVQELDDYLDTVRGNAQTASGVEYWRPEQEILDRYQTLQGDAIALGQELAQLNAKKTAGEITSEEEERRQAIASLEGELATQFNDFIDSPEIGALLGQLASRTRTQTVDLAELSALRNQLADLNAALLYPLILEDRIELVITTANSEPLRRTVKGVGREQINRAIAEFRQVLEDPTVDAEAVAQQLYRWLLEPLEADLAAAGVDTILYSPDGALRYVPLGALHDGEQWLTQRFRVNTITARSLQELTAQPSAEPRILAGAFADAETEYPVGDLSFQGLPGAGKEVALLQETLSETTALIDEGFGLQQVVPEIGRFNILHFATHAAFVPGDPSESFILFGNGDTPTLRDVGSWSLSNIDLVVLSACETGLGGFDNSGEQILGLGYQFQSRGAKAVVASLWQVSDGGTQALMDAFYTALGNGYSKAEALQRAQQALIADDFSVVGGQRGNIELISTETGEPITSGNLNHPYYWAPFILIGNGL